VDHLAVADVMELRHARECVEDRRALV